MELRKPRNIQGNTAQGMAVNQIQGIKETVAGKTAVKTIITLDELECMNRENSEVITLKIKNGASVDINIPFGTPLGVAVEAQLQPLYSSIPNNFLDNLPTTEDNLGADAKFLRTLNLRFLRHPVVVNQIEVITPNTALGESQRTEQINKLVIPYNSASDSSKQSGAFIPQFTEYTATQLLNSAVVIGEFSGILYKVLAGSEVQMNFYIGGMDVPNFRVKG